MSASGIAQLLRRRGREAGIENLHAYLFRHTFAHLWLAQGGGQTDQIRKPSQIMPTSSTVRRCWSTTYTRLLA